MAKYEVIRPWHGVSVGAVVELKKLHPALKANVRALRGQAAELVPATPNAAAGGKPADESAKLEPATPSATAGDRKPLKAEIAKRLKDLQIEFDGRKSAEELAELLPDGDPLKPATA